ncbi:hypothetical protein ABZ953_30325 [Streptomyces sp. NPDC046465]|uniref:hypothetical protein n=1 Tax=Streptomyces sp. NPDC046465 TaxID=3155810 RepID=UPI003401A613
MSDSAPASATRATAGDFLIKSVAKGGLDLGTAGSSAVLLAILLGLMGWARLREGRTAEVSRVAT